MGWIASNAGLARLMGWGVLLVLTACGRSAPCDDPGRVGLQRLTRAEYDRTVRDLFGITSAPADAFPPDSATDGFDNHAASLTVSPQLASLLLQAAEEVAIEALERDRGEIVHCPPAGDAACVQEILTRLARRVYRRPPTDAEVADLEGLVAFALGEGEPIEGALGHALTAMLMAPQFLYRGVPVTSAAPGGEVQPLDDFALGTRLSYFLWGSTPDDALLDAAEAGTLRSDLRTHFDRMLADPRSEALYDGFVTQWLQLGKLDATLLDDTVRGPMREETRLFFADLQARDGSPLEILTAEHTFVNADLAELYGVPAPARGSFERVATHPEQRAGVLTMPAILAMTSGPEEPNIVRRGVWLAEAILCEEPPPPPEGVSFELDPTPGLTERERLAVHREDPSCASCHDLIDPLGFAFEHYDALGRWRDHIDGVPVDARGVLPDGRPFVDVVELAVLLTEEPTFAECLTERTFTYALGRTLRTDDACTVEHVAHGVTAGSGLSDLLWDVVSSEAFGSEEVP